MTPQETFFKETVPELLGQLAPDDKPLWGLLNPQAMVEHLVSSWRISNGKAKTDQVITDEQLPKYREFLFSNKPFGHNIKNPVMPENEAPALRKPDLNAAVEQFKQEVADFFYYHEQHPDARPIHPFFGPLDKGGWLMFQQKHTHHHLRQFGLLD